MHSVRTYLAALSFVLGLAGLVFATVAVTAGEDNVARAADHVDSPLPTASGQLDITDVYAFRPAATNDLCVVVNVSPMNGMPVGNLFDNDGIYNVYVDNTGDFVADATVSITFSGTSPQQFSIAGLATSPITGNVSTTATPIVVSSGGIQAFAGVRDDPFFFDLVGFKDFTSMLYLPDNGLRLTATNGAPADFFAGKNVASIVMQFPIIAVNGTGNPNTGTIRAWAKTFKK
jgi:hypothetical protein